MIDKVMMDVNDFVKMSLQEGLKKPHDQMLTIKHPAHSFTNVIIAHRITGDRKFTVTVAELE